MGLSKFQKRRRRVVAYNRKADLPRTPSGRLSESAERYDREAAETAKSAKATVTEARTRLFGLSEDVAQLDVAGSSLGRLFLAKAVSKRQYDAGNRYSEVVWQYHELTGIVHPSPRAQDYRKIGGKGIAPEPDSGQVRGATDRYMKALGALQSHDVSGRPAYQAVTQVAVMDFPASNWPPHMLTHLRRGLDTLADHFEGVGTREPLKAQYDDVSDVLYVGRRSVAAEKAVEGPPKGIIWYLEEDGGMIGASVMSFVDRWGSSHATLSGIIADRLACWPQDVFEAVRRAVS